MSEGAAAQPTAQMMAADKIYEVMFGSAFSDANWQSLEQYASGKARELRSERLKRSTSNTAAPTQTNVVDVAQRKFVSVKRRKK